MQVHWKNEDEWKSPKIMSSSENEIMIVYFENEMEDTINLDDHDTTTLRFINGKIYDGSNSEDGNGKRVCVTRQKTSHYWNIWSNIAANRISIASDDEMTSILHGVNDIDNVDSDLYVDPSKNVNGITPP
eukprot:603808_1